MNEIEQSAAELSKI